MKRFSLNDMKLRNKIVLAYLLFLILPFMIVGLFVVNEYRQTAITQAGEQAQSTVERVKSRVTEMLGVPMMLSNQLMVDPALEDVATTLYKNDFQVVDSYWNYTKFRLFLDFNTEITGVKVYADNPTLIDNWEFTPLDQQTEETFWYKSAMSQGGRLGWYYFPSVSRSSSSMLSLVRSIYFQKTRTFGLLRVDINTRELNSILAQEEVQIAIVDERGVVVASNQPGMSGIVLREDNWGEQFADLEPGPHELAVNEVESRVIVASLKLDNSYTELRMVSVFALDSITREADKISATGFKIIVVVFVAALALIYSICTVLSNRLMKFNKQIARVSLGNFNSKLQVDGGDEIGQLQRQFNQMVSNIRQLMHEVEASHEQTRMMERRQNEIKLKMLASQINPHFLYNALESVRMKAHIRGEREIAQTVKMLGKLMRKNLELSGKVIALKEELEIVHSYLEIQKFRHGDRLHYELDIQPEAGQAQVLPLLIQPLVENAVIHGLEPSLAGGTVQVRAWCENGELHVIVSDNGVGMDQSRLQSVVCSLHNQDSERIGLHNIHQRLLMTYGEDHGLHIQSEAGEGTQISFHIPLEGVIEDVSCINRG